MMIRVVRLVAFLWLVVVVRPGVAAAPDPAFDLVAVPLSSVVSMYFREVSKRPYFVCDEVLNDGRLVSLRAGGKQLDAALFGAVLDSAGYQAVDQGGLVTVCKRPEPGKSGASDDVVFVYRPLYRDASYLVDFVAGLVRGSFANRRGSGLASSVGGGANGGGVGAVSSVPAAVSPVATSYKSGVGDDVIVFSGVQGEVNKLKSLLSQVDTPSGEVVVKGYIYEVGKNESDSAALDVFISALGGRLSVATVENVVGHALRLKTSSVDIVASMLKSDGRFKIVTSPFTRVRSGGTARFMVGSEVPVLGAIVTNQGGQVQQSVEYRSSGTIFEVTPRVRDGVTELELFQQVSNFVTTENGVNGSPTLNKRELRTSLNVEDGEILVIGGLNDSKEQDSKSGLSFLPFSLSKAASRNSSELLIVLELKRISS